VDASLTSDHPARGNSDPLGLGTTIVACATAAGRGAIAIVRVSGPAALAIAELLTGRTFVPRRATRCAVRHPHTGELLDDAMVTTFPAPGSYTGEDVVELTTHGGVAVPAAVLAACVVGGARLADPGEFTRRAVLHGKLDVTQAEAVGDLIDARSQAMRRAAVAQLDGGLSRRVTALRQAVLECEALVAYDIDFPEEDEGPVARSRVAAAADSALSGLDRLLATGPLASMARDGAVVVLAGPPNAGKSSLLNAIAGEARALVTEVPGTTRDAVEVMLEPPDAPWPLRVVDTAGLRQTDDRVERLGIELAERWVGRAHLVLACGETGDDVERTVAHVAALTVAPVLRVRTKADEPGEVLAGVLAVSAESGAGLGELTRAMVDAVADRWGAPDPEVPLVTRERQRRALAEARAELAAFREEWLAARLPAPIAGVHLRAAVHALETLVGVIDVEDVLDRVFGSFCVGK
jgi:tRNA modification GTPase